MSTKKKPDMRPGGILPGPDDLGPHGATQQWRGNTGNAESPSATMPPASADLWIHRSSGMRCRTCMYFVVKYGNVPIRADQDHLGRCRRHAPTMSGWPVMFENDWCGDHKLDENKRQAWGTP